MKRKFWNWVRNEGGSDMERTLFLNGEISDETWYGNEVTPKLFKDELNAGQGSITVWINSPGGDVFAAAQIYNMLRDYKGSVTVKIDGVSCFCKSFFSRKVLSKAFSSAWTLFSSALAAARAASSSSGEEKPDSSYTLMVAAICFRLCRVAHFS